MNVTKLLIISILTLFLSSCSPTKPLTVLTVEKPSILLELDAPKPLKVGVVEWRVVTCDQKEVIYGVNLENYKLLSNTLLDVRHYIFEQNQVIYAYKDFYEKKD